MANVATPMAKMSDSQRIGAASKPLAMKIMPVRADTYGNCISDMRLSSRVDDFMVDGLFSVMKNLIRKAQSMIIPSEADTYSTTGWSTSPMAMNGMVANAVVDNASEYASLLEIVFIAYGSCVYG